MSLARRRVVAALASLLIVSEIGQSGASAQDPPRPGQGPAGAREKAARKRPARRKPRGDAVGLIVPYPMPPVLIIRQTPEAHDEIRALLNMLRY